MWYKISERGLIQFDSLANKMAEIIYPQLENAKNDYKTEIDQIKKNYNILNSYYKMKLIRAERRNLIHIQ